MSSTNEISTAPSSLPIMTFHSIDDQSSVISFSPRLFEYCLTRLDRLGYTTIKQTEVINRWARGINESNRAIAITFDDGYASVYQSAFPLLVEKKFTATIFLTVGQAHSEQLPSLNGRAMLSWTEIREMHKYGIEFGAHTLTHPDLTQRSANEIELEMRESKERIEQMLGASVSSFAYPFGRFNAQARTIARQHFVCAVSDRLGLARSTSDPYALDRVESFYLRDQRILALLSTPWLAGYLQIRNIPRQLRRAWQ